MYFDIQFVPGFLFARRRTVGNGVGVLQVFGYIMESFDLERAAVRQEQLASSDRGQMAEGLLAGEIFGFGGDDVDWYAFLLGEPAYVIWTDYAGIIRAVGEDYDYFPAGYLGCIANCKESGVEHGRGIAGSGVAQAANGLLVIQREAPQPGEIVAERVYRYGLAGTKMPDKIGYAVLGPGEAFVHTVAGIK